MSNVCPVPQRDIARALVEFFAQFDPAPVDWRSILAEAPAEADRVLHQVWPPDNRRPSSITLARVRFLEREDDAT
jgi:hypothetical protein